MHTSVGKVPQATKKGEFSTQRSVPRQLDFLLFDLHRSAKPSSLTKEKCIMPTGESQVRDALRFRPVL